VDTNRPIACQMGVYPEKKEKFARSADAVYPKARRSEFISDNLIFY
jgi:hypothetical protein